MRGSQSKPDPGAAGTLGLGLPRPSPAPPLSLRASSVQLAPSPLGLKPV